MLISLFVAAIITYQEAPPQTHSFGLPLAATGVERQDVNQDLLYLGIRGRGPVWRRNAMWLFGMGLLRRNSEKVRNNEIAPLLRDHAFKFSEFSDTANPYTYFTNLHFGELGDWDGPKAERCLRRGLVSGYPDLQLRPESPITRGELATILARWLLTSPAPITLDRDDRVFRDVSGDEWWCGAAQIATRARLMNGLPDGSFRGANPVSRDELVTVVSRLRNSGY